MPGAADDGGQDADTAPELPPPAPARQSTAALRSAGDDDTGVVQEPVEQADGGGVLGQEPAPLVEGPVAGDAQRAAFVGGGDERGTAAGRRCRRAGRSRPRRPMRTSA